MIAGSFACVRKQYACSAYQSMFYVDKTPSGMGYAKYDAVAFDSDSLPKVQYIVKRNSVLLISKVSKCKRERQWKTVPMVWEVPPRIKLDSSTLAKRDSMLKAEAILDSLEEAAEQEEGPRTTLQLPEDSTTAKPEQPAQAPVENPAAPAPAEPNPNKEKDRAKVTENPEENPANTEKVESPPAPKVKTPEAIDPRKKKKN